MDFRSANDLPARHGFFTRNGGVSSGVYASLNCGLSGADAPENVRQNRALVAAAMGVAPERLLGLKQVHGRQVVTVTAPWAAGDGPAADAMVSDVPGVALGVITADCAPVLFADATGRIVGAAHAGWRGALAGVLEATVAAMQALGAEGVSAAIGPCIGQASYEVAADLRDAVLARDKQDARFFAAGRPERWQFDLAGYCVARLAAFGVRAEILPQDTCADEDNYFSHRRRTLRGETAIGHQISVIRA
jgi:YfiH family protein